MEQQRPTLAVPRELNLAEEQRVIAAPVRAHDPRDEVRERAFDERCLVNELERRLWKVVGDSPGESIREAGLLRLEDADAEARALVQERAHLRAAVDRDEHERRPHETDMNAFAVMPCTCSPTRVVSTVTPGGEHPECPAEGNRRITLEPLAELERLGRRRHVVRRTERLGAAMALAIATSNSGGLGPSTRGF